MYTITEAASILKGTLVLNENDNQTFRYLLTDSRQIGVAGESLFLQLKATVMMVIYILMTLYEKV